MSKIKATAKPSGRTAKPSGRSAAATGAAAKPKAQKPVKPIKLVPRISEPKPIDTPQASDPVAVSLAPAMPEPVVAAFVAPEMEEKEINEVQEPKARSWWDRMTG